jgi:uncharacterized protein (TIGR02145 family)
MKYTFIILISLLEFKLNSQTTVTDVSGNIYKTVKIGNQIWMAENLRTEKFNNGDPIPQITSNRYWQEISVKEFENSTLDVIYPAMCFYNNEKGKDNALYNFYTVVDSRGLCPAGWHIPLGDEYVDLINSFSENDDVVSKLKLSVGFNALAMGGRTGDGVFGGKNEYTLFWTESIEEKENEYTNLKYVKPFLFHLEDFEISSEGIFNCGASVRCIKN